MMNRSRKTDVVAGLLFLSVFGLGVTVLQVLQGPWLYSDTFLADVAPHSTAIIASVLLGFLSGSLTILISTLLYPLFRNVDTGLAHLYIAFCVVNFIAIGIDNVGTLSMLELSREYLESDPSGKEHVQALSHLVYRAHWWSHQSYLLLSCLPVFTLYAILYRGRLIPRVLSAFGMAAAVLMLLGITSAMFGHSISDNMLLPIALIQIVFPLWLLFKGVDTKTRLSPA